jgi:hypothetical protein
MLCGFLLLHKVHSPQYTLWLLPFFVVLAVPWRWVIGYLVVDAVMGIAIFRWLYARDTGGANDISAGLAAQSLAVGVWGSAALLVVLFVVFLSLPDPLADRERRTAASVGDLAAPGDVSLDLVPGEDGRRRWQRRSRYQPDGDRGEVALIGSLPEQV